MAKATASKFQTPSVEQGFGTQYYGTNIVAGFMYDVSTAILYTIYPTINYDVYLGVPLSLAQQFSVADRQLPGSYRNPNIPYPDDIYNNQINNQTTRYFHQCLITETGAPLLCDNGNYITVN